MAKESTLFHESWHRIANQRISLRASVNIQRQMYRGSKWYVLQDPFSNNYYRLRPATYQFVARLSNNRTIDEVWNETMSRDPDNAPGQGEVIELLAQLYHANLLHYSLAPDSAKLFERHKKRKQRMIKANLMNIMFFRIPLFDPDALLKRFLPIIRMLLSPLGTILWLGVVVAGLKIAIENFAALRVQSQGILSPSNLFLLYLGLVIIKTLHEFGHSFAVRRFGGEVHTMGVMFLIFNPLPYMDASAAWSFRNKWKRVFVGAAGMIFEIFVAACAIFFWANTGPGLIHSLAYNMVFIASVSTILFNINPLLRFDGYYILSDLLDIPNLHQQSRQHLTYLIEQYGFGCKNCETPATTRRVSFWLTVFGILSSMYRVVVFTTILLFVADRFLLAGMIMAAICAVAWIVVPFVKLLKYLATSPRLDRVRLRAITLCGTTAALIFSFFYFCPFPSHFKAPGVLKAVEYVIAVNKTEGFVEEIIAPSGSRVNPGDPLMHLKNTELTYQIKETQATLSEARVMYQKAMTTQQSDLNPIGKRIDVYTKKLKHLQQQKEDLLVTAESKGIWVSPEIENYVGMWMARGTPLGQLIDDNRFFFVSVVSQQDVSQLFSDKVRSTEVKLYGQAENAIQVSSFNSIPMEQTDLPSSALGWGAGGDIAIDASDDRGVKTTEPFYEVRAVISQDTKAALLHGRSGKIKFDLSMEPLIRQWWRKLRQLIQKRYQI